MQVPDRALTEMQNELKRPPGLPAKKLNVIFDAKSIYRKGETTTWIVLAVLGILWAIGYTADLSGPAIHLLLVVAVIVFVVKLVNGRKMS